MAMHPEQSSTSSILMGDDEDRPRQQENASAVFVSDNEEEEEAHEQEEDASIMSLMSHMTITTAHHEHEDELADQAGRVRVAENGDIVTMELELVPENGFVPEPLFDTTGRVSFVVGWGNYLPGLHQLVKGRRVGDVVQNVSIDAGWGSRREDLVFTIPKRRLMERQNNMNVDNIQPQTWLKLNQPGSKETVEVWVDQVTHDAVVLDANPPLAGSSYSCSLRVLSIDSLPSLEPPEETYHAMDHCSFDDDSSHTAAVSSSDHSYQAASFALGCFWGAELAFARREGVVGTKVGYTQGITPNPTYQQVCTGTTRHREAVMVIYNPREVSYRELLDLACQRIEQTADNSSLFSSLFEQEDEETDDDERTQYKHGFYFHNEEQHEEARLFLEEQNKKRRPGNGIELLQASTFYNAEESHQQYLYKGGQSARKGAKETIRCFG